MKLVRARIQNYRSIEDTGEFDIGDLTCLVGKNEAGKTAILQAIEALRPYGRSNNKYDITNDYPRRFVTSFNSRHPNGAADVCTTWWKIDAEEIEILEKEFGDSRTGDEIVISGGYNRGMTWSVPIDEEKAIENLLIRFNLSVKDKSKIKSRKKLKKLIESLRKITALSEQQKGLLSHVESYRDENLYKKAIDLICDRTPKFLYVSHYDRMSGQISVNQIEKMRTSNAPIDEGDEIFLSLLNFAGTTLEDLKNSDRYEELKAKCEAASNAITSQIFEYWSQNDALEVEVDFSEGRRNDKPPFNSGVVVRARIKNNHHKATVPFSERSAGFVWFFSFLVKFAEIKNDLGNVIVLLDEPGLTLHGKAQADLLRYIEEKLLPNYQVVYSTHSPFLIPAHRLADVRIVEDVVTYPKEGRGRPELMGTKVYSDALTTDKDTLFPLQGALGYDICQSLFVGKDTLLVEGPSDVLYLQALSTALKINKKSHLHPRWTLCPAGGIDKVQPFVSLFSGNHLNVVVLTDQGKGDKSKIERLRRLEVLKAGKIFTIAELLECEEADMEDIFLPNVYAKILNESFGLVGKRSISGEMLMGADSSTSRIVKKAEVLFREMPSDAPEFDHFTPSYWLLRTLTLFGRVMVILWNHWCVPKK